MRILITADAVGGVWQYTATLANLLAGLHGVHALVVAMGPEPSGNQLAELAIGARMGNGGIDFVHLPAPLEWQDADDAAYAAVRAQVLELALQHRAHLVHANEHHLGELGKSGMPILVVSHSDLCSWRAAVLGETAPAVGAAYLQRVKAGLAAASCVVAPSVFIAESLARWYGYTDVVRLVPNGVGDLAEGMRPARIYDALIAGRLWDPAKNFQTYAEAIAGLPGHSFAAAGPLAQPGQPSPAPPERMRYLGTLSRPALRAALARSRLLVAPSLYDPFGLVPVEAALAGCCLVLGDIPSYRDLWGESAVYVEPRQPDALRETIVALLDDAPRRTMLSEAARAHARARYTADRMAASYLQIYQRTALRYGLAP